MVEQYSSNYTLNLILSSYITKAKNEDIKVFTQIELPETSAVSDMDLCVIFSNVIENATNACKGILNIENRSLSIICKSRSDKLFIQITNSFDGNVEFDHDLQVSTDENHGFGIKSIVAVVQNTKECTPSPPKTESFVPASSCSQTTIKFVLNFVFVTPVLPQHRLSRLRQCGNCDCLFKNSSPGLCYIE